MLRQERKNSGCGKIRSGFVRAAKCIYRKAPDTKIVIGYFADGVWAHNALKLLSDDRSIDIAFISARYNNPDKVLRQMASDMGYDFLISPNVNSERFLSQIEPYKCDLFVSMSFNQIFKSDIINTPPMKTINCHAGALPFYRGCNVLTWALINDEKAFGVTCHYVDEGIDTGDIILQRFYEINDNDTYATLLNRASEECAKVLYDAIKTIQYNEIIAIIQSDIHPVGMYCGQRRDGDEIVNWDQTSREIFNFIRAICKPGPMARSSIGRSVVKINKAQFIENVPCYKGIPGQVIGKDEGMLIVKTNDSYIKLIEFECPQKIKIGDRLRANSDGNCNI